MTKFVDSLGLKRLVTKIAEAVSNGTWLPVRKGDNEGAVAEGHVNSKASGRFSHAEGFSAASGSRSHAEGSSTTSGDDSHAEGNITNANGDYSHAEGWNVTASGEASHAEGDNTKAKGRNSHAEGRQTKAYSVFSHAEGYMTETGSESDTNTTGGAQHAEGYKTKAVALRSHAEGSETQALGFASHAEGLRTISRGYRSHTEGQDTCILSTGGHAQGMANYHTNDLSVIHDIGIGSVVDSTEEGGTPTITRLSAEAIVCTNDNKNGYKYMIGVGGYKGQAIGTDTKSVQEVIADLEKGVEAAQQTISLDEINEIMGA